MNRTHFTHALHTQWYDKVPADSAGVIAKLTLPRLLLKRRLYVALVGDNVAQDVLLLNLESEVQFLNAGEVALALPVHTATVAKGAFSVLGCSPVAKRFDWTPPQSANMLLCEVGPTWWASIAPYGLTLAADTVIWRVTGLNTLLSLNTYTLALLAVHSEAPDGGETGSTA